MKHTTTDPRPSVGERVAKVPAQTRRRIATVVVITLFLLLFAEVYWSGANTVAAGIAMSLLTLAALFIRHNKA